MTLWPGLNITPKFSVGVGFSNDRISGIERNFAQAAESLNPIITELTKAIDLSTQETGEDIGKALSTKFDELADKDEFLKNNKGNIKAFFENDFAKVLTPEILLNANTGDKQKDLNWLLTRSISAFLLSLKANAMRELDQKTKMEGL